MAALHPRGAVARRRSSAVLAAGLQVLVLAACGGESEPVAMAPTGTGGSGGAAACAPGEVELGGGGCRAAGVPEDACGQGFEPDGRGGCNPILPAETCPRGQLAVPGDAVCRTVAPCAAGVWGDVPVDATTQHVSAAYTGGGSDGTAARPWTTIQEGVAAAAAGAVARAS